MFRRIPQTRLRLHRIHQPSPIRPPLYTSILSSILTLLSSTTPPLDPIEVDEIVYVGGTGCLPGLDEHIVANGGFDQGRVSTPFSQGTVVGGGVGDPTTILSRGCAVQAALIEGLTDDEDHDTLKRAFTQRGRREREEMREGREVRVVGKTVALYFPAEEGEGEESGTWITGVLKETPLPTRRTIQFDIGLAEDSKAFAFEVWEVEESIEKTQETRSPREDAASSSDHESEDDDDEPEITKTKTLTRSSLLATASGTALLGIKTKGLPPSPQLGKWTTTVECQFVVGIDGRLDFTLKEIGKGGVEVGLSVCPPPS